MEMGNLGIRKSHTRETNKNKISREQLADALFYTALFIDILIVIVEKSDYIIQYEGKYFQLTFLLFGLKVLLTKYSNKEWGLIFAFGVLGAISYFSTGRNEIMRLVMMIAASKNISLQKVMKLVFYTTLIGVTILILLSATGIYGVPVVEAKFRWDIVERRYTLGLGHPNALHCMIWALIVLVIYLFLDKMKWYHFVLLTICNILFFLLTDSRTGMLMTMATLILALILAYCRNLRVWKGTYLLGIFGVLLATLFSVMVAAWGTTIKIFEILDRYVTGRILWSQYHEPISQWSLFSNPTRDIYQDMGFIRLFDWYGYIPGIIYTVIVCIMIWDCYKNKKYKEFIVIMTFTAYTVFEAHAISVYLTRNYLLLLLVGEWNRIFGVASSKERYIWNYISLIKNR